MTKYSLTVFFLLTALTNTICHAVSDDHDHNDPSHPHERGTHAEFPHANDHKKNDYAESAHQHNHEHERISSHRPLSVTLDDTIVAQIGIELAEVRSVSIQEQMISYGKLALGSEQLTHVRARYPGMIKTVKVNVGDKVKKGSLLAMIESNDTLKSYSIVAPITGTVIQRHANTGETSSDLILLSIASFDKIWAELRIYPRQQNKVSAGQKVLILANDQLIESTVRHIIPSLEHPYHVARLEFNNSQLKLSPGIWVEARIITDQLTVKQAVKKEALQTINDKTGVFIKYGNEYRFTEIQAGRADDHYVEILTGLKPGQTYVAGNSYLLKADIEKSEAEHVH